MDSFARFDKNKTT